MPIMTRYPEDGDNYRHEGSQRTYKVLCLARDNDRDEILVIHQGEDGTIWSRTLGNFMGLNAEGHNRFTLREADHVAHSS